MNDIFPADLYLAQPSVGETVLVYSTRYNKGSRLLTITGITPKGRFKCNDGSLWGLGEVGDGVVGFCCRGTNWWGQGYVLVNSAHHIARFKERQESERLEREQYADEKAKRESDPKYQAARLLTNGGLDDTQQIDRWMLLELEQLEQIQKWLRDKGVEL
jgi:hypothetical protein